MALTQPALIPQPWGSDGQVGNIPQDSLEFGKASWAKGFPTETAQPLTEGGIPPSYLDFQGVLNALSAHAVFMQSGAHYAWSNTLDYPAGCFVLGEDGKLYQALQDSGPGYSAGAKNPTTSTTYWQIANFAEYLPLSGGVMVGQLRFNQISPAISQSIDNYVLRITGGTAIGKGAILDLWGEGSENPGGFQLCARTSDGYTALTGDVDGPLKWGSNKVLTTADSATIAGYAMPSSQYVTLTLAASNTQYTAPANGYFVLQKTSSAGGEYLTLYNRTAASLGSSRIASGIVTSTVFVPAKKGDSVAAVYSYGGATGFFRFVYAEGDNA